MTISFGVAPGVALSSGTGAESRRPLGLAVVGGLLFSQLLPLYAMPVLFLYMEALRRRLTREERTPV